MIAYIIRSLITFGCLMAACYLAALIVAPIVAAIIGRRR